MRETMNAFRFNSESIEHSVIEQQLKGMPRDAELLTLRLLMRDLYYGLAKISPEDPDTLRHICDDLRKDLQKIMMGNPSRDEHILIRSEFEEALEGLLNFIRST